MKNKLYEEIKNNFEKENNFIQLTKKTIKNEFSYLKNNKKISHFSLYFCFQLFTFILCISFIIFLFIKIPKDEQNVFFFSFVFLMSIVTLSLTILFLDLRNLALSNEIKKIYKKELKERVTSLFPYYKGDEQIASSINSELEKIIINEIIITNEEVARINEIITKLNNMVIQGINKKSSSYQDKLKEFYSKLITTEYLCEYNSKEKEHLQMLYTDFSNDILVQEISKTITQNDIILDKYTTVLDLLVKEITVLETNNIDSTFLDKAKKMELFLKNKIDSNIFLNEDNFNLVCSLTAKLVLNMKEEKESLESRIFNKIEKDLELI